MWRAGTTNVLTGQATRRGCAVKRFLLTARIFAVVDALAIMTHEQPDQRARPLSEALESVRQEAGTRFDPRVVADGPDHPRASVGRVPRMSGFGSGGGTGRVAVSKHGPSYGDGRFRCMLLLLNLTTKMTGYQRFLFVCLPQRGAEAELATALDRLEEGIENVHEVAGHQVRCGHCLTLLDDAGQRCDRGIRRAPWHAYGRRRTPVRDRMEKLGISCQPQ